MSGLLSLLQQSAQSLQAQQAYSSTVAHNLANSNTPGYARQRAEIAAVAPSEQYGSAFIGRGAVLQTVTQARDRFVEAQLPAAIGSNSQSATQLQALQGVTVLDPNSGLADAVSNFYSQMRQLSQDAGSMNYREAAIGAAQNMALAFNRTANALESARSGVDVQLTAKIPEINDTAAQIASFNLQIRQARASGGNPNDLLDARQRLGDRLTELTGAIPVANEAGDLNLTLANGTSLVTTERSAKLSTISDATNRGHLALQITLADGTGPSTLRSLPGGEVGGLLAARDGAMASAQSRIDTLAYDLGNAINAISTAGFGLDGSTGHNLFNVGTTSAGAASTLSIDAATASNVALFGAASSSPVAPGDATNLQRLVATESTTLSSGLDASGTLSNITASFGSTAQRVAAANVGDKAMLDNLTTMRESTSGVSIDEELVNMQRAQRSYEAVTRVIKTADEMLSTLMSIKS